MSQSIGGGLMGSSSYRLPGLDGIGGLTRPKTASGVMQQSIDRLFATRGSMAPSSSVTTLNTPGGGTSGADAMLRSIPESGSVRTGTSMNASTLTDPDASGTGKLTVDKCFLLVTAIALLI